jgi:hypothetical protein
VFGLRPGVEGFGFVKRGLYTPSKDIRDAWAVVEKMSSTTKENWTIVQYSSGTYATFEYEGGRDLPWSIGVFNALGDDAPHAICLAAIMATEQ